MKHLGDIKVPGWNRARRVEWGEQVDNNGTYTPREAIPPGCKIFFAGVVSIFHSLTIDLIMFSASTASIASFS